MKKIWNTKKHNFGFITTGKCWNFKFEKYNYSTCVYHTFWRFFYSTDKIRGEEKSNF